ADDRRPLIRRRSSSTVTQVLLQPPRSSRSQGRPIPATCTSWHLDCRAPAQLVQGREAASCRRREDTHESRAWFLVTVGASDTPTRFFAPRSHAHVNTATLP